MGVEKGVAIDTDLRRIYATDRSENPTKIVSHLFDGTEVPSEAVTLNLTVQESLAVDDDYFYCGLYTGRWRVYRFSRTTGERDTSFDLNTGGVPISVDISSSRIFVLGPHHHSLWITDLSGNRQLTEERTFRNAIRAAFGGNATITVNAIATNDSHIFVQHGGSDANRRNVKAFTHSYILDSEAAITFRDVASGTGGLAASNTRLYRLNDRPDPPEVEVYHLGTAVNFGGYVPYQFDSADGDTIFLLCANNTQGNAVSSSTLSTDQGLQTRQIYRQMDRTTERYDGTTSTLPGIQNWR